MKRYEYHQSSERILAEPGIESKTTCSQVLYAADWAIGFCKTYYELIFKSMLQNTIKNVKLLRLWKD